MPAKKKSVRKPPKNVEKYLSPRLAAFRLIKLAMDEVLLLRKGIRVKWELKLSFYHTPEFDTTGIVALPSSYSMSSGDDVKDFE